MSAAERGGETSELLANVPNPTDWAPVPGCTYGQWLAQVKAVANLAEALRENRIPNGQRYAATRRLLEQAQTLAAWTRDDRGQS